MLSYHSVVNTLSLSISFSLSIPLPLPLSLYSSLVIKDRILFKKKKTEQQKTV